MILILIMYLTYDLLHAVGFKSIFVSFFFNEQPSQSALWVAVFKHIMNLFLNELDFMVIGHIYLDKGYAIPLKPVSRDK